MTIGKDNKRSADAPQQTPPMTIRINPTQQTRPIVPITTLIRGFDATMLSTDADGVHLGRHSSDGHGWYHADSGKPTPTIKILTRYLLRGYKPGIEWFSNLNGQLIVDLGAGVTADGYQFAQMMKARAYIGIDGYNHNTLARAIREHESHKGQERIPAAILGEDMLDALKRFPASTVSVLASAIDSGLCEWSYLKEVEHEIRRVLHPEGLFVSFASYLAPTKNFVAFDEITLRKYFKD